MRTYKGWTIEDKNVRGMYVATNYSGGYGKLMADTLAGIKQLITETINEAK